MSLNIAKEVAALERMTVGELQARYVGGLRRGRPQPTLALPHPPDRMAASRQRRGRAFGAGAAPG